MAPAMNGACRGAKLRLAFWSALFSMVVAFAAAAAPWPRHLVYLACVVLLALSAALVAITPETVTPGPGAWRSLRPQLRVPQIALGYAGLALAATLFTLLGARDPHPAAAGNSTRDTEADSPMRGALS